MLTKRYRLSVPARLNSTMEQDIADEAHALRMQIKELSTLRSTTVDEEFLVALRIQRKDLLKALFLNYDLQKTIVMLDNEEASSRHLIASNVEEERQAARDRSLAMQLSSDLIHPDQALEVDDIVEKTTTQTENMFIGNCPQPGQQCVSCNTYTANFDCWAFTCEHGYCRTCLNNLFEMAMKDRGLFPPRCCRTEIIMDDVEYFFEAEFVHAFRKKYLEFTTVNPLYCSNPRCSEFLPPATILEAKAACPACDTTTCSTCQEVAHEGDCQNGETQEVLQVARDNGWQRCNRCNTMIELTFGCNHITFVVL
jgi:hypothetical protein